MTILLLEVPRRVLRGRSSFSSYDPINCNIFMCLEVSYSCPLTYVLQPECSPSISLLYFLPLSYSGEWEVGNNNVYHAICVQGSQFLFSWCIRKVHGSANQLFWVHFCSSHDQPTIPSAFVARSTFRRPQVCWQLLFSATMSLLRIRGHTGRSTLISYIWGRDLSVKNFRSL